MSDFRRELVNAHFVYGPALALILVLLISCGAAGQAPAAARENTVSPSPEVLAEVDISTVPELDTSLAKVPLGDIVFDTFGRYSSRYVPLDRADDGLVLELRDAINQARLGSGENLRNPEES